MKGLAVYVVCALWLLSPLCAPAQGLAGDESFSRINQDFREGRYEQAARGYEDLAASGRAGGHVYYNLGNACLKMGRPGEAILNYERARLMIPRDKDLSFNLSHALDLKADSSVSPAGPLSSVFFWIRSFALPELFWAFALCNGVLFAVLLLRLFWRAEWGYYLLMATLFLWFMGGLSFGLKLYETASDSRAVVVAKTADALAGPEPGDTVLFNLTEGAYVACERSEHDWILVSLPDGRRGWVRAQDAEVIVDRNLKARLLPF
ncbi:MAG TPA: tetratricopeptide repeat protein [Deltaproteobacteria bacterium]|jgi:tetratricopeptide (TPR) repeat protein|nr:tetratricopeptide repeat protein [Deltaproteobacteria bacterium]HOI06001.1 tetratricopeptide repeat protein [Deltaproteobacteria bacterium]